MNLAAVVSAISLASVVGVNGLSAETVDEQGLQKLKAIVAERECEIGPVARTYGSTGWLVYGCAGTKTLRFVAAPGNPSWPFDIVVAPKGDAYEARGGGAGNPGPGFLALQDVRQLSPSDIAALLAETQTKR
jgi:hypothetical protein